MDHELLPNDSRSHADLWKELEELRIAQRDELEGSNIQEGGNE